MIVSAIVKKFFFKKLLLRNL